MKNIKKSDIYNFIKMKQMDSINEKVKPLEDEVKRLKDEYAAKIIVASGVNKWEIEKYIEKLKTVVTGLRDSLDSSSYRFNGLMDGLSTISDTKTLTNHISNHINFKNIPEIDKLQWEAIHLRRSILEEYEKIEAAVRVTHNGKKAYTLLEELGFDVSNVVPEVKNEMVALEVNNELLGLPEKKDDSA